MLRNNMEGPEHIGRIVEEDGSIEENLFPRPEHEDKKIYCPAHKKELTQTGYYFSGARDQRINIMACSEDSCGYEVFQKPKDKCPIHNKPLQLNGLYYNGWAGERYEIKGCPESPCGHEIYEKQK